MLDQKTVSVKTVNGFKSKLEEERSKRMGLFMDWSLLGLETVLSMVGAAGPVSYLWVWQ